jgi:hypothetical protein
MSPLNTLICFLHQFTANIISFRRFPFINQHEATDYSIGGLVVKLAVAIRSQSATSASPGFDSRPMHFLFCLYFCNFLLVPFLADAFPFQFAGNAFLFAHAYASASSILLLFCRLCIINLLLVHFPSQCNHISFQLIALSILANTFPFILALVVAFPSSLLLINRAPTQKQCRKKTTS